MEQNKSILIVDDEMSIQRSLRRSFFGLPYTINIASSGKEALEILQSTEVDMVISDFKMPLMDGVELLTEVKKKYPAIIRFMISGYIDKNKLMDSLFQFTTVSLLPKPWDEELLHNKVEYYFSISDSVADRDLWNRINSSELINYRTEQGPGDASISDFLKNEPSLLCGLLHVYNSEYYNGGNSIDIMGIINHFSKESLLNLFNRTINDENCIDMSSFTPFKSQVFSSLYEEKSQGGASPLIPPFMFSIYSYIYRISFNDENSEALQLLTLTSDTIEFTKITLEIFSIALTYLRYWNTAPPLEKFAEKIVQNIKSEGFSGLSREDKLLFLCDYSLKNNNAEVFSSI